VQGAAPIIEQAVDLRAL